MSQNAEVTMSRRRLLKLIAATGGAVAASGLVPAQWITPVVNVGTLPALAQEASPWVEIVLREKPILDPPCEGAVDLLVDYYDPTGGITGDTVVCREIEVVCDGTTESKQQCTTLDTQDWSEGASKGSIYLDCVCLGKECHLPPGCTATVLVWMEGSNVIEVPCQWVFGPWCRPNHLVPAW
jgi:hypothetical protein